MARFAQHWNFPGGSVEQFVAKRDVLHRHCADIGRDPAEITISTHLRGGSGALDVDELVDQAKRYDDAGLDLGIVYLPVPHTPDVLDEVATALSPLSGKSRTPATGERPAHRGDEVSEASRVARQERASAAQVPCAAASDESKVQPAALRSLQVGQIGNRVGSRVGIHFFPQRASIASPVT